MATPRERTAIRLGVVVLCLSAVPATVAAELACERLLIASAAELLTAAHPDFSGRSLKNDICANPTVAVRAGVSGKGVSWMIACSSLVLVQSGGLSD
jgi:hypothetical protein